MAGLSIEREELGDTVVLKLDGTFDAKTASLLRQEIEALASREVVLDFSRVRKFVDSAVAVLTGGLDCHLLRLRGLGRHEECMFRYFGLAQAATPERAYYTPEEVLFV